MIQLDRFLAANPEAAVRGPVLATSFPRYCFDSRVVRPGELFLAVRTDRGDGHDYIAAACRGGAAGVVCEGPPAGLDLGATCIVVPDTRRAIEAYAAAAVVRSGIRVLAITGSAGKTSTKEAVAHVLAHRFRVFRNPGNFSGLYGLPIALGELADDHEVAVLEMATDHFGEIAALAEIAPPEVAVVTAVAPAHLAAFRDLAGVAKEKGALVEALPPEGLAVLNADDPLVVEMGRRTKAPVLECGFSRSAPVRAADLAVAPAGTTFTLIAPGGSMPATIPWLGANMVRAALVAAALGLHLGLGLEEVVARLATLEPVAGRLRPIPGRRGALILDDSYNASPEAVVSGLQVMAQLPGRRRVAVLGEMAELGVGAEDSHRRIGAEASAVADVLVAQGNTGEWVAQGARRAGMDASRVKVTYTAADAVAAVEAEMGPDTLVFVKGSAVARMEQVVAGLMAAPERARELLVRQDAAWRQIVVVRPDRPTWLEIDLGAIGSNVRRLAGLAAPAGLMVVLKADGYGHGAVRVARTALHNGAEWLAVACLPEAAAVRRAGIDAPILVLGYTPAWQAREAVSLRVSVAVFDEATARAFSAAGSAVEGTARVHVKVDTGMHRLGVATAEAPGLVAALAAMPALEVEGLFTHLAAADDPSPEAVAATEGQLTAFGAVVEDLEAAGLRPPLVHAANSAAVLGWPGARYDLVRPGIAVYGLAPSPAVRPDWLRPALAWKTQVAQVRNVEAGEAVGYGLGWAPKALSTVATIPVGYADGFRRAPATWRHVLVRGQAAPVVGRVSMDQATVDVTAIPGVRQGDEVVLIGRQGGQEIGADQVADWLGTIGYEVVSAILARVPRVS